MVEERKSKLVFSPPRGDRIVSMIEYRDMVLIATEYHMYIYGPKDSVDAYIVELHVAEKR